MGYCFPDSLESVQDLLPALGISTTNTGNQIVKLKSKHKWCIIGLLFILSWVGLLTVPFLGFQLGFPLAMGSFILLMASAIYGIHGMIDANVFERFFKWLKTDDV